MKRVIYGTPMKAAAFILSMFVTAAAVLSAVGVVVLLAVNGYGGSLTQVRNRALERLALGDSSYISSFCSDGELDGYAKDWYENTNLRFTVKNEAGEVIGSTYNGEATIFESTDTHMTDRYVTKSDEYGNEWSELVETDKIEVTVYIASDMSEFDEYYYAVKLVDGCYAMRNWLPPIALIGLVSTVALLIYLICSAGRTAPDGSLKGSVLDRIPFDVWLAAAVAISLLMICVCAEMYYNDMFKYFCIVLTCVVIYVIFLFTVITFASRVKQNILIRRTVVYGIIHMLYRIVKWVFGRLGYIFKNLSVVWKTALITTGAALLALVLTVIPNCIYTDLHAVIWFMGCLIVIPAVLYIAVMLSNLKRGGERIASGDLNAKIATGYMLGDFKRFGESLNHISDGVRSAVDAQMRSERMKTELITNVSHDIKTPLTSIINYVDLIKKQEPENEQTREYVEVLDRQSTRLKKLIEDLVEASKASSGTLSVELTQCDVSVLLSQAVGEFDERLSAKNLQVIMNCPEYPVNIMADGRRLWRVFDNLLNNICKYALESTRVYLDLFVSNGRVYVTFRNISKYPLNISGDELMERFVRGDRSRNTEGSGLGLSIAKSLTELQNGNMDISIDGDLFKVILEFGVMN